MSLNMADEYSPSSWSKRFPSGDQVISHHYEVIRSGSELARTRVPFDMVAYGDNPSDRLHLYGSDLAEDSPICVFVHGGYWQAGAKEDHAFMVIPLYNVGYRVVVLGYELCPNQRLEQIVEQIVRAAVFLDKFAAKARHLTYVGHSAGAHLIVCMVERLYETTPALINRVRHLFLLSGVYDLSDLRHTSINQDNILGLDDRNTIQLSPLVSLDFLAWSNFPHLSIHVSVAENDSATFKQQSAQLGARFKQYLKSSFEIILECDHFDIVENLSQKSFKLTQSICSTV